MAIHELSSLRIGSITHFTGTLYLFMGLGEQFSRHFAKDSMAHPKTDKIWQEWQSHTKVMSLLQQSILFLDRLDESSGPGNINQRFPESRNKESHT